MKPKKQKDLMRADYKDGNVVVTIPMSLVQFAQAGRGDFPLIIFKDRLDEAGKWIAENILEFGGDSETGLSRFQQMLDDLCDEAVEDGQDFIAMEDDCEADEEDE